MQAYYFFVKLPYKEVQHTHAEILPALLLTQNAYNVMSYYTDLNKQHWLIFKGYT